MRLAKIAAVGLTFALGGCIDMDVDLTVLGPDTARMSGYIQVSRGMLDMMGGAEEFCPPDDGGSLELTDEFARCNMLAEGTFDEVFQEGDDGEPGPTATDLGDGTVLVQFPMSELTGDMSEMNQDPQMAAMFRPMLEGHSITIRISGAEIVSTNGTLSADGTSASVTFLLTDVMDEKADLPDIFETVVRY